MIPLYIISRAVEDRFHTPRLLIEARVPFTLVVDSKDQLRTANRLECDDVVVSPFTEIVAKRNFISSLAGNDWYIGMDDNIREFTMLSLNHWGGREIDPTDKSVDWRKEFRGVCSPKLFVHRLYDLIELCEKHGTVLGGVATNENPYFRANKYAFRRFVKTKVFVMKAGCGITFKHALCHDSYITAQTVARYGCVVVNNFLHYTSKWYEKGGIGNRKAREEKGLLVQLDSIIKEFPGLVDLARGENSALRFLLTNDKSVNEWRRTHGYLSGSLI